MGLTVRDIVQMSIMHTAKIRCGKSILDKKVVEWVTVIELPVENFVKKNELVLSTGIGCEDDPVLLEQFVKDIIDSGASVLGLATGRYIYDIPDQVLELAKKHQFIILEIPWEIRFGDILKIVLEKINQDKQGERQKAETVRQELINCVLHGKSLQDIANLVYKYTKIPVAITDQTQTIRAERHFDKKLIQVFFEKELGQLQQIPHSNILFSEHPLYHYMEEYMVNDQMCFQLSILNNQKSQGSLFIQVVDREQLTWFVMNVLEHALTACALYFVKENAVEMTKIRLNDNFILNLAKTKGVVTSQIISKAQLLGHDLTRPYICIVGKVSLEEDKNKRKVQQEVKSLQSLNYYLQKEITNAAKLLHRRSLITFEDGEVIVFLEADHHPYMETANQFLDVIERRLYELLTGVVLSWGIATHKDGHYAFHESYKEASTALDIGKRQKDVGERTFFSDTKINRLLMAISKDDEIADIVKTTIQPLLDYDRKRQTDLIYTFMIYNKYKGNVSQTARVLNLHRQSLLHRLRNIESLTQLSLVDSDDLFLLELSVRLWMLKEI